MPRIIQVLDGPVIEAGESLSSPLDCSGGSIFRITMPAAWNMAHITFQASSDGQFFNDIFSSNGREIEYTVHPGTGIILTNPLTVGWLKIRSGSRHSPVPQEARREFSIAIDAT